MANSARGEKSRIVPPARGGPGTNRGHDYQINCAVFRCLELITKYFAAPHEPWAITLEPRLLHDSEAVSRWDIRTEPRIVVWEAKLNVTKQDLDEWLLRIRDTGSPSGAVSFGLVYGGCRTAALGSIRRLKELAVECDGDSLKFANLAPEIKDADALVSALGPHALDHLKQLRIDQIPEDLLKSNLEFRAQHLAGKDATRLLDLLFRVLSEAAVQRRRIEIHELVERCRSESVVLTPPGNIALADVHPTAQRVVVLLKACRHGLPKQVVAGALASAVTEIEQHLAPLVARSILVDLSGEWRLAAWPHPVPGDEREQILTSCFDLLLDWIELHETSPSAVGQLYNAMDIAPECLRRRPGLALKFFQTTEHIIKDLGDKHRLLEMSELCVEAAKDAPTRRNALPPH